VAVSQNINKRYKQGLYLVYFLSNLTTDC